MADFKPRNILLIGATGNIGRFITRSIVSARGEFDRVAILTSAPAAGSEKEKFINEELKPKNVEIIVGDISNEEDVLNAYKGIDTVIFALGRGAILPQIPLIKLAASSGSVEWIFPSEYGTDIKYGPSSAGEPTHQGKLKVRAYIEEDEEIKNSGLKYTYVVTGPYPEMFLKGDSGYACGWDVKSKKAYLLEKDNKISFTTMKDTGDLVLAALRHPGSATFNKALKVNSYTTTPAEIQAEFERQVGGGWTVQEVSLDALKEFEKTAWKDGRPDATLFTLRRIWAEGGTLYEKRDNDVIGEPATLTLKDTVAWYIKATT